MAPSLARVAPSRRGQRTLRGHRLGPCWRTWGEEHTRTAPTGGQLRGLEVPQHPSPPAPWHGDGAAGWGAPVPTVPLVGTHDSLCCWCCGEMWFSHTLLSCAGK